MNNKKKFRTQSRNLKYTTNWQTISTYPVGFSTDAVHNINFFFLSCVVSFVFLFSSLVSFAFWLRVYVFFLNKRYILIYIQLCRRRRAGSKWFKKNFHMIHFRKQDYYHFSLNSVYVRTISWSSVTSVITNWNSEYSMESCGSSWRITKR